VTRTCQARAGSDGQTRCAACRIVVDADEADAFERCKDLIVTIDRINARAVAPGKPWSQQREPFVSALAPDPWSRK
jgi:hypothetical protein